MTAQRPVFFNGRELQRLSASNPLDSGVLGTDVVRSDGSVPFTQSQEGVDPTSPSGLTTRRWVTWAIEDSVWGAPIQGVQNAPPGSPVAGQRWVVGTSPTGAWAGESGSIAVWRGSAWVFITPTAGYVVRNSATSGFIVFNGTAWVTFAGTLDHNDLANISGGSSGQRFHLTSDEHDAITGSKTARHVFMAPTSAAGPGGFRAFGVADISGGSQNQAIFHNGTSPVWGKLPAAALATGSANQVLRTSGGVVGWGTVGPAALGGGSQNQAIFHNGTSPVWGKLPAAVLAPGSNGQVLKTSGGAVVWGALTVGDINAVPTSREIATGDGLSGGGTLGSDLTLSWDGFRVRQGESGSYTTRRDLDIVGAEVTTPAGRAVVKIPDARLLAMVFGG